MLDSAPIRVAQGSVKDIYIDHAGDLHFAFTDRISVFDYGALPEEINGRAEALAQFAKIIFSKLQVPSLYAGDSSLGNHALKMKRATHAKFPSFSENTKVTTPYEFIPLEIIFRWGVPLGSKLLQKKEYSLYQKFEKPLIQYTTKLEAYDRDLSLEEAATLLPSTLKLSALNDFAIDVATQLQSIFENCGLDLWDGKLECAYDPRNNCIYLLDAFTPDELRLTLKEKRGTPLSKEILRNFYNRSTWPAHISELKNKYGENWKKHLSTPPPALGQWRLQKLSLLYKGLTECLSSNFPEALDKFFDDTQAPKVFVMGSGGREAALKWKLQNENCVLVDNPHDADATIVSTDGDLEAGSINKLSQERVWALGPTREAAQIEWSKNFGKEIAKDSQIPLARWTTQLEEALQFSSELPVLKQDGLAAGKGVLVPTDLQQLKETYNDWKTKHTLCFEERLSGPEASVFFWVHPSNNSFEVGTLLRVGSFV